MRDISKTLKVSVGTLYNYYDNQENLWCDVFNKMWKETEISLNEILLLDISKVEKLKQIIIKISNDIRKRNGYGYKLFDKLGRNEINSEILIYNVREMLNEVFKKVVSGNELQKEAKINIIITLLLNSNIEESDFLFEEYIKILS